MITLGSSTSRAEFEASPVFAVASPLVDNPPWKSWSFVGGNVGTARILVSAYFEGSALRMIDLVVTDEPGSTWDEWTTEKEAATKERHDALCRVWLGNPTEILSSSDEAISGALHYVFPWGKVLSGYDSKGGASSIMVRYEQA
ncbi:MAG TPA: hypothetical protein PLL78_06920 [Fimbriimonadaceae bacterium]|nr:hypothetical protein [Fimbriimonadaceae bacterium]HRJ96402.1 hypothetical protein [Fimbriimonadaceae bacterium]